MSEQETRDRVGLADLGLGLMAVAAGSSDALAYLKLGNVFTSAMTGNTVLLCIAIGQQHVAAALQSFTAFGAFVTGAAAAVLTAFLITRDYEIYVFIPLAAVMGALLSHQAAR